MKKTQMHRFSNIRHVYLMVILFGFIGTAIALIDSQKPRIGNVSSILMSFLFSLIQMYLRLIRRSNIFIRLKREKRGHAQLPARAIF